MRKLSSFKDLQSRTSQLGSDTCKCESHKKVRVPNLFARPFSVRVLQSVLLWGKDPILGMKRFTPNLRFFLISIYSFCLCGSRVAYPIINGLIPSPARFETRLVRPRIEILSKQDNNDTFFI